MSDSGRRGREQPSKKAKSALAELVALRKSGQKRVNTFEIKEEQKVFDVVDEAEYAELVKRRREVAGGFIVGDNGLGYEDIGEEDDWAEDVYDDEAEEETEAKPATGKAASKANQKGKGGNKKRPADDPPPTRYTMQRLLAAAAANAPVCTAALKPSDESADALLDDILGSLEEDTHRRPASRPGHQHIAAGAIAKPVAFSRKPALSSVSTMPSHSPSALRTTSGAASTSTPKSVRFAMPPAQPSSAPTSRPSKFAIEAARQAEDASRTEDVKVEDDMMEADAWAAHDPDHADGPELPGSSVGMPECTAPEDEAGVKQGEQPACNTAATPAAVAVKQEYGITPAIAQQEEDTKPNASKTPWKTPPPVFHDPLTPATAAPSEGWQQLYNTEGDAAMKIEEETCDSGWVDDGSLPLDDNGQMHLFLLDAHQEPNMAHTVYLFGKVKHNGSYLSCCAVVTNMMRTLYFVPRSGSVPPPDDALTALESAAQQGGEAKKQLISNLHDMFAGMKQEVRELLVRHNVSSMVMRPVKRDYAFELDAVPRGQQYVLKVKYPAAMPALPFGIKGESFCAVLGSNQNMVENLLLKRKIMGPCWIQLKQPTRVETARQLSWTKLEVTVPSPKHVLATSIGSPADPPPLTVAALNLKTIVNLANNTNEVVAASVVYHTCDMDGPASLDDWKSGKELKHFSVIRKINGQPFPPGFEDVLQRDNKSAVGQRNGGAMLCCQSNERMLLTFLLARLQQLDADVLVGHNLSAWDMEVLLHRMQHHKVNLWSRIGRLKRSTFPSFGGGGGGAYGGGGSTAVMACTAGRLLCDTYLAARELLREVEYTLSTLSMKLLQQQRTEINPADIVGRYSDAVRLHGLMQHSMSDAWLCMGLMYRLNILPLTRNLSVLSGSLWNKTLQGQRAQRIEMLLLHEFHQRKFMLPDKLTAKEKERLAKERRDDSGEHDGDEKELATGGSKRKAAYAGGLVLEPKKGLYDKFVLLLDFNSLYPSIIQEYNIDFTTVERPKDGGVPALPPSADQLAVLPTVIQSLVQRRRAVKGMLRDEQDQVRRNQLDIRQQALKLTANSMYGCLGFTNSRFYAKPLAELITAQGREILQSTVDLVHGAIGLEVIYGDTDSIMVASNTSDVSETQRMAARIKREVNRKYKHLEIELDGIFKCMLLLKKKKYAAVKLEAGPDGAMKEVMEQKGLDIVRRDWCPLSKDVGNFVLQEILSGKPSEDVVSAIHAHLSSVNQRLEVGEFTLNKFVITKSLTKSPEDYPDANNQPHVQVALRRKQAGKRDGTMQGETVPYIICVCVDDKGAIVPNMNKGMPERAYHPDELKANDTLRVDLEYYRAHQIHPVVSRLCAPIESTDAGKLAQCLGLDPVRFRSSVGEGSESLDEVVLSGSSFLDDEDRYKDCQPLMLRGSNGTTFQFAGVSELLKGTIDAACALQPPDAQGDDTVPPLTPAQLSNQVMMALRKCVGQYYEGWLRSDDATQTLATRNVCLRVVPEGGTAGAAPPDPKCSGHMVRVINELQLYTQLTHVHRLLDVEGALARWQAEKEEKVKALSHLDPILKHLGQATQTVDTLRRCCAFRYVSLGNMFG